MSGEDRVFTAEDAQSVLPEITASLAAIKESRQVVLSHGRAIRDAAPANGGGRPGREYWEALSTLRREVEALSERGVILRDPETGLVDFPARRDGRDVFLCWRLGEDRVAYWHGPETGFSGRAPL